MSNQIMAIAPYWCRDVGTWVFDDEAVDLRAEPFVAGMPELIDDLVVDILRAKNGFRLLFSSAPFPGHQRHLVRLHSESGGWWYGIDGRLEESGWLCPALFKYFDEAPLDLYVKAESKS